MDLRSARSAMVAGIAFGVLFLAGFILFISGSTDTSGKDAKSIAGRALTALGDSGHRARTLTGTYLLLVAALALVWFVVGLRARLQDRARPDDLLPVLVQAFGTMGAVCLAAGAGLGASLAGNVAFGGEPLPQNGELAWLLPELGMPLLVLIFPFFLAATAAVTAVLILRTQALPRWTAYVAVLGVLGGLGAVFFMPLVLVPVWAIATGIAGTRTSERTSARGAVAAPAI